MTGYVLAVMDYMAEETETGLLKCRSHCLISALPTIKNSTVERKCK